MLKSLTTLTLQLSLPLAPLTLALPSSSLHPCLGRGELRPRGPLEGRCACARGYGGERCELVIGCPLGCSGRGECEIAADGGGRVCACEDGWRGAACEEARCPADCAGRGRCVDGPLRVRRRCHRRRPPRRRVRSGVRARYLQFDDVALRLRGGLARAACDEAEAACVAGGCGGAGVCAGGVCRCTGGYFAAVRAAALRRRLRRPRRLRRRRVRLRGRVVGARLRGARLPGHAAVLGARPLPRRRVRLPRGLLGRRLLRRAGRAGRGGRGAGNS